MVTGDLPSLHPAMRLWRRILRPRLRRERRPGPHCQPGHPRGAAGARRPGPIGRLPRHAVAADLRLVRLPRDLPEPGGVARAFFAPIGNRDTPFADDRYSSVGFVRPPAAMRAATGVRVDRGAASQPARATSAWPGHGMRGLLPHLKEQIGEPGRFTLPPHARRGRHQRGGLARVPRGSRSVGRSDV